MARSQRERRKSPPGIRHPFEIDKHPFAGAKGDLGLPFIVAFRSAKMRILTTYENKNILSRSERRHWATADWLPLPWTAFHCRLSLREKIRILTTYENKNVLSRSERQWATADWLPLPFPAAAQPKARLSPFVTFVAFCSSSRPREKKSRDTANLSPSELISRLLVDPWMPATILPCPDTCLRFPPRGLPEPPRRVGILGIEATIFVKN